MGVKRPNHSGLAGAVSCGCNHFEAQAEVLVNIEKGVKRVWTVDSKSRLFGQVLRLDFLRSLLWGTPQYRR